MSRWGQRARSHNLFFHSGFVLSRNFLKMRGSRFMKTSVASVTFRRKSVCEVAELARRAGLDAIEWGRGHPCAAGNA